MTLEEKGPITPPPQLSPFPQQVSNELQRWEGIVSATHWDFYNRSKPDGADFYVGAEELGHIHLNGEVHLATGKELATVLIKNGLAQKFPWGADWVTVQINSDKEATHAVWLFGLNYKRIQGASIEVLVSEITSGKSVP